MSFNETKALAIKECLASTQAFDCGNGVLHIDMNKWWGSMACIR